MRRKFVAVMAMAAMTVSMIAGCGSSAETEETAKAETSETVETSETAETESSSVETETTETASGGDVDLSGIKIGLIIPGTINDQGWSQLAYDGVMMAADKGAEVNYSENIQATDYEATFRGYADNGYDIVIAHGAEFWDTGSTVAEEYPDTQFIITSCATGNGTNCEGVLADGHELGFINGAISALLSKSGKIAAVSGTEISSLTMWAEGVQAGAAYINPDAEVITSFTGSLDDAVKAKEATYALIEKGCDVVTPNCDSAGQGAVLACDDKGVMCVGTVSDMSSLGDSVVISVEQDLTSCIYAAIEKYATNGLSGEGSVFGYADGANFMSDYAGTFADSVTDEQKAKIQEILDGISSGTIDVAALCEPYTE